jgi:dUTP pyrophosphatase
MKLPVKKLYPSATIPTFATPGAACFDLTATTREGVKGNSRVYGTGLAFSPPDGYYVELYIRSGLAFKQDFILANGVAIIDNDYRGEVKLKLTYLGDGQPDWPLPGERIAQGRLVRQTKTDIHEVTEIEDTQRGEGGFGSTGR